METPKIKQFFPKHRYLFEKPPEHTPADHSIDAPLLGNGDVGVAIAGNSWTREYLIAKNDFWKLRKGRRFGGGPAPIGSLTLNFRDLFRVGTYRVKQDIRSGVALGEFASGVRSISTKSWVAATENILIIEVTCKGEATTIDAELSVASGRGSESECREDPQSLWGSRKFSHKCQIETGAGVAVGCVFSHGDLLHDLRSITISSGESVLYVVSLCSNFESTAYVKRAKQRLSALLDSGVDGIDKLYERHCRWWEDFWGASSVHIDDSIIEKQYYLSQYILASASRNPGFPPPIFGTWITTDDPAWMGDYHLNYNHMAPYYGLYSSNHIEQTAPYDAPILDFFDRGSFYAKSILGIRGVYYPVGIGPKGVETTWDAHPVDHLAPDYENEGLFFGQKSNAAYAVVNMSMRWFATYDLEYAETVYPFIKAVAEFWQDYLTWDGERYISKSDSIHEGSGPDMNPILSLGLVRCVMTTVIDMGRELSVDEDRHAAWQNIFDNLSDFPVFDRRGKQIFRLTETGVDWWENNTLAIQHIYPSGAIGPDSDPKLLRISRDTIEVMDRWFDGNGMNSFYPAAVRVGYNPDIILSKLREHCTRNLHPNGFTISNPHGIETCSTVPNTINEMLCMSHSGVIRVFYNWPRSHDASFETLRAHGAFLVSSGLIQGVIDKVTIISEKGRTCRVANPWPGNDVELTRNGGSTAIMQGDMLEIDTSPGETIELGIADSRR